MEGMRKLKLNPEQNSKWLSRQKRRKRTNVSEGHEKAKGRTFIYRKIRLWQKYKQENQLKDPSARSNSSIF